MYQTINSENSQHRRRYLTRTQSAANKNDTNNYHLHNNLYSKQNTIASHTSENQVGFASSSNNLNRKKQNKNGSYNRVRSISSKSLFSAAKTRNHQDFNKYKTKNQKFFLPTSKQTTIDYQNKIDVRKKLQQALMEKMVQKSNLKLGKHRQHQYREIRSIIQQQKSLLSSKPNNNLKFLINLQKNDSGFPLSNSYNKIDSQLILGSNINQRKQNLQKMHDQKNFNRLVSQYVQTEGQQQLSTINAKTISALNNLSSTEFNPIFKNKHTKNMTKTPVINLQISTAQMASLQTRQKIYKNLSTINYDKEQNKKEMQLQRSRERSVQRNNTKKTSLDKQKQLQKERYKQIQREKQRQRQLQRQKQRQIERQKQKQKQRKEKQINQNQRKLKQKVDKSKYQQPQLSQVGIQKKSDQNKQKPKSIKNQKQIPLKPPNIVKNQKSNKVKYDIDQIQQISDIQNIVLTVESKHHRAQNNNKTKQNQENKERNQKKPQNQNKFQATSQKNEKKVDNSQVLDKKKAQNQIQNQKQKINQKLQQANTVTQIMTPVGQVASYCSQSMKKSKLNWEVPAVLLYKQCFQQFKKYQPVYIKAAQLRLITQQQAETCLNQNNTIQKNLQKLISKAKKKGLSNQLQQLLKNKNYVCLDSFIQRQVLKFSQDVFKTKQENNNQKNNMDTLKCLLRMINGVKLIATLKKIPCQSITDIQNMRDDRIYPEVLTALQQISLKKLNFER